MNLRRPHAVVLAAALTAGVLAVVPPAAADVPGPPAPGSGDVAYCATWQIGMRYKVGELVIHNNATYRCLQAHTSLPEWEPDTTPPLWQQM
ncbi:carbohydrate-binding protein [Streptosporangium sp. NPDC020145]|uniref:carbohydrate-binding protein n=1 Tax=Streptosporangium sp. NPDC020145 TaxID=3154694 RepID=UPI003419CC29